MWDSAGIALGKFLDPFHLGMLLFGVLEGVFVGLLPGMGGVAYAEALFKTLTRKTPSA